MFGPPSTPSCVSQVTYSNASDFILPSGTASQNNTAQGPVAILWDIENCEVPKDVRPEDVAGNIRMALRDHPVIQGAVNLFSAYGDFNAFTRKVREGCQRTGVKLVDVPNGRKDAADKAILVDMFLFALDNPPPSSIMLITGDVDFAPALHILGQRGYTVILVIPNGGVSPALCSAGKFVADWSSVARGEGFVASTKNLISPRGGLKDGSGMTGYCKGEKSPLGPKSLVTKAATARAEKSRKAVRTGKSTTSKSQSPSDTSSEGDHHPDIVDSSKSTKGGVVSAPKKVSKGPKKAAAAQAAKPMKDIIPQKISPPDVSSEGLKNCVTKAAPAQARKQTQAILPQKSTASKADCAKKRRRKYAAGEPSQDADMVHTPSKIGRMKVIDGVTLSSHSKCDASPNPIVLKTDASDNGEIHQLRSKISGGMCARAVKRANAKHLAKDKGNTAAGVTISAIKLRKSVKAKQAVKPKKATVARKSSTTAKTHSVKKPSEKKTASRKPSQGFDTEQIQLKLGRTEVTNGGTLGTPDRCNGTVVKGDNAESHPGRSAKSRRKRRGRSAKKPVEKGNTASKN